MNELSKQTPEYETVMSMKGVGDSIGPRLIAEIGDPRRFHSAKALIAYAGIDAPPYQSGKFRVTDTTVEIYYKDNRIATHNRFAAGRKNQYSTNPADMPEQFKVTPWDDERIKNWAAAIGPYTAQTINRIFDGVSIKEQGYNPSLAVLRLSKTYSEARLETACEFAITKGIKKPRYHHLKSILAANQDKTYLEGKKDEGPDDDSMGYLRGSDYYD